MDMNYGSSASTSNDYVDKNIDDLSSPSPPSHIVELATLTVPSDYNVNLNVDIHDSSGNNHSEGKKKANAVVLHASKETTHAFVAADRSIIATATATATDIPHVDDNGDSNKATTTTSTNSNMKVGRACIQAVVDLETLSNLAHATDDEFVGGLHREANDHSFKPPSRMDSFFRRENNNNKEKSNNNSAVDEEAAILPLLRTSSTTSKRVDVPLEILPFADVVMETTTSNTTKLEHHHSNDIIMMDDAAHCTTTAMDDSNVLVGHDGFLLELPKQLGDKEHRFVLALPERQLQTKPTHSQHYSQEASATNFDEDDYIHRFPMLEKTISMMSVHLPTDIQDVQLEAKTTTVGDDNNNDHGNEKLHLDLKIKRQVPVIGYLILLFGFFALASAGAAYDLQGPNVSASMKTYWRLTSTVILIFPKFALSIYTDGLPKLSRKEWLLLPAAGFAYAQMTTVFVVSLALTSLANAFVFSNMTSLVIIGVKTVMGLPVLLLESSGALIGIAGGIICARDTGAHSSDVNVADGTLEVDAYPDELMGNLIALSASFGTAAYLAIARDLRSKIDLYVYMWSIFFLASFFVLGFMIVTGEPVEFSRHPDFGMFGWMNTSSNRLPLEIYMAVVVNLIGTLGYISVLKYFDSIVVSVIMLMEPVVGVFIGYWVGVDSLPAAQTWIGSAIVTFGSGLVVYSGSKTTESIDATKAVRPRSNTIDHDYGNSKRHGSQTSTHVEMHHTPIMMRRPSPKERSQG